MSVVMEISFYHYYSGKSLMRLQSRDCTFVQKAGFSLQFHCSFTVKVCSVINMKMVIIFDPLYQEIPLLRDQLLRESTVITNSGWHCGFCIEEYRTRTLNEIQFLDFFPVNFLHLMDVP